MIVTTLGKKPTIHRTAYVAPSATISGDVTIGAGCAILAGAVLTAEGAPLSLGDDCVVMEHAVLRSSGGSALAFPLRIGARCLIGPHAYLVGATLGEGCFIATAAKAFNGARLGADCCLRIGAVAYVNAVLAPATTVPAYHVAAGDPLEILTAQASGAAIEAAGFYQTVFNLPAQAGIRGRAAATYSKFLRKAHAQDAAVAERPPERPRRTAEEPPPTQVTQVDKVVDVMMFELEEMEHRRQEAIKRQKRR